MGVLQIRGSGAGAGSFYSYASAGSGRSALPTKATHTVAQYHSQSRGQPVERPLSELQKRAPKYCIIC